jgi:hypothetical protein
VCERSCDIPADGKGRDANLAGVGPACSNGTDGQHSHYTQCERTPGRNYGRCECRWPWYGELCERRTDARNCTKDLPCEHGGTCSFELREGTYGDQQSDYQAVCACLEGWSGTRCTMEDPCVADPPCQHGGKCSRSSTNKWGYKCDCPEAYPEPPNCAAAEDNALDGSGSSGGLSDDQRIIIVVCVCVAVVVVVGCVVCKRKRADGEAGSNSYQQTVDNRIFYISMGAYGAVSVGAVIVFVTAEHVQNHSASTYKLETWDLVCLLVTLATLLCVPRIMTSFKHRLADVIGPERPALTVSQDSTGWGGAMMFVWGLVDMFLDIGQSVSLASCGHWWLFACSTVTFLATAAVSIYLGWHMLSRVARGSEEARSWIADHGKLAALVVLASSSRLESVAILRLRLCDRDIIKLPIEPAYFHFIRHAGMFHFLIEDFPHSLVGVAQLTKAGDHTCGENGTFEMPVDAKMITLLNVIFSLGSIVFGVILRSMQMLVLRAARGTDVAVPLLQ